MDYYVDSGKVFAKAVASLYGRPTNPFIASGFLKPETMTGGNTIINPVGVGGMLVGGQNFKVFRQGMASAYTRDILTTNAKSGFRRIVHKAAYTKVLKLKSSAPGSTDMPYIPEEILLGEIGQDSPYRSPRDRMIMDMRNALIRVDTEKAVNILRCCFEPVTVQTDGMADSIKTWEEDVDDELGMVGAHTKYVEKVTTDFASTSGTMESMARSWLKHVNSVTGKYPSMPADSGGLVYIFLPETLYKYVYGVLAYMTMDSIRSGAGSTDGTENVQGNGYFSRMGVMYVRVSDHWMNLEKDGAVTYYVCPVMTEDSLRVYAKHYSYNNILLGNVVRPLDEDALLRELFSDGAGNMMYDMNGLKQRLYEATAERDVDPFIKMYAKANNISLADFYLTSSLYVNLQQASTTIDSQSLVYEATAIMSAIRASPLFTRKLLIDPALTPGLAADIDGDGDIDSDDGDPAPDPLSAKARQLRRDRSAGAKSKGA
jgi:hypothetical protein